MASPALIAGGLLLGGGLLLLWRRQAQQKQQDLCAAACAGDAQCLAACAAGKAIAGLLGDAWDAVKPGRPNAQVLSDEAKHNDALNGPIKTKLKRLDPTRTAAYANTTIGGGATPDQQRAAFNAASEAVFGIAPFDPSDHRGTASSPQGVALPFGLGGNALEYENGCTPFKGTPGWGKCAAGTVDMFGEENRLLAEDVLVDDNTAKWHRVAARAAGSANNVASAIVGLTDPSAMFTGSIDPMRPDPTTQGPIATSDGKQQWLVAGQPLVCNKGDYPVTTADGKAFVLPGKCAGRGTQVLTGACPPPAGFTWDVSNGADYLRRLRAGEQPRCKTGTTSTATSSPPALAHNIASH